MAKDKHALPNTAISEKQLRRLMQEQIAKKSSELDWAKSVDVTPQSISAFRRKTQGAGLKLPAVLGYRPQTVYIPLDAELISTPNPQRKATAKPSGKTDPTKEPIEKGTAKAEEKPVKAPSIIEKAKKAKKKDKKKGGK